MRSALVRVLFILLLFVPGGARVAGQSAARERPKLKDFGNSLDRLGWDEKKRATVERKARKGEGHKAGRQDEEDEVVRVETSLVVCDVLVLDRQGRSVPGLTREDFLVTEDGTPQELGTFALGDDARVPRTIVLVIDYSSSQYPFIKMSVEAAKALVDRLGPRDLMALVTDDVELISDFTNDRAKLKKKLDELAKASADAGGFLARAFGRNRRFGRSMQFSALMATLREAFDEEDVRPVVIFQTDGDELGYLRDPIWQPSVPPGLPPDMRREREEHVRRIQQRLNDNRREFSLRDLRTAAEKARATIYTVVPGQRYIGLTFDEQMRKYDSFRERLMATWRSAPETRARLDERYHRTPPEAFKHDFEGTVKLQQALIELSESSGGWADFLEEPAQAAAIYERILSDVNRRYVLGYQPTNKGRDGKRRRVQIEVRGHPEYTVWGRKSYYAPGPDEER